MTLGLLTHENGLFIFPALVGVDWVRRPGSSVRERARRLWPFAVPPALFAGLLVFVIIDKMSPWLSRVSKGRASHLAASIIVFRRRGVPLFDRTIVTPKAVRHVEATPVPAEEAAARSPVPPTHWGR